MTIEKRIGDLEKRHTPPTPPVTFELIEAPPGLSREEHDAWLQKQRESGPIFTLDLGAASLAR
jgi:hypothetical protein